MTYLKERTFYEPRIINDSEEILEYMQIGINIPVREEFHQYILHDLSFFGARSIVLEQDENIIGHVLIYDDMQDTLYFGYCGVKDHIEERIAFLIDELVSYAKLHNFKFIRGPINIPTVIYGFGFMKEGSLDDLFAAKPVNPPIYQNLFLKSGFNIKFQEYTWEGPFLRVNPYRLTGFDFSEYQYFTPDSWEKLMELKPIFLEINAQNFPDSSKITPNIGELFDNYADFIVTYGGYYMFYFVRHIPTDKIIGCGCNLPNPFSTDSKGRYNSIVGYSYAVEPEHRKKSLAILMYGANSMDAWKDKMRYGSVVTGEAHDKGTTLMEKLVGIKLKRTHLILEVELVNT